MPDPRNAVGDAFFRYLQAGFSVIPIGLRSKRPMFSLLPSDPSDGTPTFKPFLVKRPTTEQVQRWVTAGGYPGILAGPISGNLWIFDFDDREFCEWLLSDPRALDLLQKTWTVRSGSGKVHVYLKDDGSHTLPGQVKLGNRKLADVRVTGNYAVAPPALHDETGEAYVTIFGSPETVLTVPDAYATIMGLVALVSPQADNDEVPQPAGPHPPAGPRNQILPPVDPKIRQVIANKLRAEPYIPSKIKRAIREGVIPGDGEWGLEHDRSKITSDVVAALMEAKWSLDVIELTLASFPIGELVYRNLSRKGSNGHAWLAHTYREKQALFEGRQASVKIAKGQNFEVLSGDCETWPDGNIWKLIVKTPTTPPEGAPLTIKTEDLKTYGGWVAACMKFLHTYPLMAGGHQGQNYHFFATAVMNTCAAKKPPEDATTPGRLKGTIIAMAEKDIYARTPDRPGQWVLGWRDQHNVFLLPSMLATRLQTMGGKNPPTDREIHDGMTSLGAVWVVARYGERREHSEQMWRLPLHVVMREPHRNGSTP